VRFISFVGMFPCIGARQPEVNNVAATEPLNAQGEILIKLFGAALARWAADHPNRSEELPTP
jgi:hypothetical protein